ncbi:MAG: alanine racemase, partial [Planctomycetota bacterium]
MFTRPRATIDLNAVVSNWRALHELTNGGEVAAVVKANAYGHGAEQVSTALLHAGCHRFFVATIDEAVELRAFLGRGPQILILDGVFDPDLPLAARHQLTPVLNSMLQVKAWAASPASDGHAAVIHIDTGMKRLGVPPSECAAAKAALDSKSVG